MNIKTENSKKLTYLGSISQKLAEMISENNLRISFTPSNTLQIFFNAKSKTDRFNNSRVYELNYKNCNTFI